MSDLAIKVDGLGKKYKIGQSPSGNLRESFSNIFSSLQIKLSDKSLPRTFGIQKDKTDKSTNQQLKEFWALKDVSFEIRSGEAIGIIGPNGAGKSTLLKIISRITEPTTGRVVINGRVSSLLEVGTGFHPELTGRENIYLNGTILGMKRREIKEKFDDILTFSGIDKFIDTPVKHYSSGMKVRLAFSVAAHLQPEILLIDEVLAVGDSVFQKKCLDKITEITKSGMTVLFVSHNMQAVKNLCNRTLLIQNAKIIMDDTTDAVIMHYLNNENGQNILDHISLENVDRIKWAQGVVFKYLKIDKPKILPGENLKFEIALRGDGCKYNDLLFGVNILDNVGNNIIHLSNIFKNKICIDHKEGNKYFFEIRNINLKPGTYTIDLFLRANEDIQDWLNSVGIFEIGEGNVYGFENSKMIAGLVQPDFDFWVD